MKGSQGESGKGVKKDKNVGKRQENRKKKQMGSTVACDRRAELAAQWGRWVGNHTRMNAKKKWRKSGEDEGRNRDMKRPPQIVQGGRLG